MSCHKALQEEGGWGVEGRTHQVAAAAWVPAPLGGPAAKATGEAVLEAAKVKRSQDKLDKGSGISTWEELMHLVALPGLRPVPGP